ncbi:MAG: magnesium transporter CorA family protein [Sphingobacteriia bacterium]
MIALYDQKAILVEDPGANRVTWVSMTNPSHTELAEVEGRYELPLDFLTAALDPEERARFEVEDNVMLILLRIPIRSEDLDDGVPYITRPLGIILAPHILVTICTRPNSILDEVQNMRRVAADPSDRIQFVLNIFDRATLKYLRFLKDLDLHSQEIEDRLRANQKNTELLKLLNTEKSLVFFRTSLQTNQFMLERIKRTSFFRTASDEHLELLEDVIIDNAQAIEMANIYTSILESTANTFASVINNNLSRVMKGLTQITIILMLPTLLASIYGMNIHLPLEDDPNAFVYVSVGGLLLSLIGIMVFRINRNL